MLRKLFHQTKPERVFTRISKEDVEHLMVERGVGKHRGPLPPRADPEGITAFAYKPRHAASPAES